MADETPVIRFHDVTKCYGADALVLEAFNLEVRRNAFVSLVGPSGCGKSTLLKLAAGLMRPSAGAIQVEGKPVEQVRDGLFFVFQEATLLPWLRVRANVELPLKLRGAERQERQRRAATLLELVRLSHAADRFPRELSEGMKMRVSLARALSVEPRILLLDEPFGALDEITRNRLNEELLTMRNRRPFTALFVTHSIAEAVFLSSEILVLAANPGRVSERIEVPFGYPRRAELRETPEYLEILARATRSLREAQGLS